MYPQLIKAIQTLVPAEVIKWPVEDFASIFSDYLPIMD